MINVVMIILNIFWIKYLYSKILKQISNKLSIRKYINLVTNETRFNRKLSVDKKLMKGN